ncbi:arsinothricin resistance N-acetyltransferase ArsN1 family B [Mycobacterium sp. 050134]|uniref:arsinothricin resistance N-acetyltransferase ArsN1 family B n=1 Tax=Mycobacterium sp. 050134 TaxID=3096111 RepID=UPI002EDA65AA
MATPEDAEAVAGIYLPYVRDTAVSFETEPPDAAEMRSRLAGTLVRLPWLVASDGGRVAGYAYAGPHGARDAYRWSADVSLYLDRSVHRRGYGRRLYAALFELLAAQGYVNAYAAIVLPNPASVGLHEAAGFTSVGFFPGVGFKQGAWRDIGWWHLRLRAPSRPPEEPRPWRELPERVIRAALTGRG